jgi:hypothetical protein
MPKRILNLSISAATLPVKLGVSATKLAVDAAGAALGLVRRDDQTSEPPWARPNPDSSAPAQPRAQTVAAPPEPVVRTGGPTIDYDAEPRTPIDRESQLAKTIEDEDELVAESADPGAEDGPGATIEVDAPWDGYAVMHADAIIARIDGAAEAELAVLELYERAHKSRQTVLAAAEQRLKVLANSRPGS